MEAESWLQTGESGGLLARQDSIQECFCWYWSFPVKYQGLNSVFMVLWIMNNPLDNSAVEVSVKWE